MRTIGVIGGMSWESSALYYRHLNEGARALAGGLHSAPLLMHSVDFAPISRMLQAGDWDGLATTLGDSGARLRRAGAEFLLLATNTMHKVAGEIERAARLPLLHIGDAVGQECARRRIGVCGLLATAPTMQDGFYADWLQTRYGVKTLTPPAAARARLHRIIFDELCQGRVLPRSKQAVQQMAADLLAAGAEGILLGCTDLGLLLHEDDCAAPLLDSAALHAQSALWRAMGDAPAPPPQSPR